MRVESAGTGDTSRVAVADSLFVRNQIGIDFVVGSASSNAWGALARNSFQGNSSVAIQTDATSYYISGGGNLVGPVEFYSGPFANASF